jgi:phage shock protein E
MTHAELKEKIQKNPDLLVMDIREAAELDSMGAINGAVHVPMGRVFIKVAAEELPKNTEMVVYCASGKRAGIVAKELQSYGYVIDSVDEPLLLGE